MGGGVRNSILNKKKLKDAKAKKKKYYFRRTGKCIPSVCSSACCRYTVSTMFTDDYFDKLAGWFRVAIQTVKFGKTKYVVSAFHCPDITIGGQCASHGTKKQSPVCDEFPITPSDGVYKYVESVCTYSFTKTLIKKQ